MIPLTLTIEGVYSYQERQTIDFNDLTAVGLFGIFGATGSGKSTILEAITFALYGETERLNSKNSRAYNMMNLKSNKMFIELEFENYEKRRFRAIREYRRNSKKFFDVNPIANQVIYYEWLNNEYKPIEDLNIEEILGLSYENFKRTIIIPQGQFKEFLELKSTDRTTMMKEIFNLHRYDFQDVVARLAAENKTKFDVLSGKLGTYDVVQEEDISAQKQEIDVATINQEELKKQVAILERKYQELKRLKEDVEALQKHKNQLDILTKQVDEITILEQEINTFEKVSSKFKLLLTQLEETELTIKKLQDDSKEIGLKQQENSVNIDKSTQSKKAIQPEYDNLANKRQEGLDLESIIKIKKAEQELEKSKERYKKGSLVVEEAKLEFQKEDQIIREIDLKIKKIEKDRLDTETLFQLENWFNEKDKFLVEKARIVTLIEEQNINLKRNLTLLQERKISKETYQENFLQREEVLSQQLDEKQVIKTQLEVKKELAHFAHSLKDGEACLLCGSAEHPKPLQSSDNSPEIKEIDESIRELTTQINLLHVEKTKVENLLSEIAKDEKEIELNEEKQKEVALKIKHHDQQFTWKEFDKDNKELFVTKRNESVEITKTIDLERQTMEKHRQTMEKLRLEVEKYQKALEQIRLQELTFEAQIKTLNESIKKIQLIDYKYNTISEVQYKLDELTESNQAIERQYIEIEKQLTNFTIEKAGIVERLLGVEKLLKEAESKQKTFTQQLASDLLSEQLSLENVQEILNKQWDISIEKEKINRFKIDFETLKKLVETLKSRLSEVTYNEKDLEETEKSLIEEAEKFKQQNDSLVVLKTNLARNEKLFEEKKELLKEFSLVEKRNDNLDTMKKLFYKAGFVQYVSSIYLAQLCEHANVRFSRMTRGQLRLTMNDKNEFEVIDYLNEGKTRSVNTLSGGQAFQASLALALALADSVQSQAKSDKNFFFIDEGFGTQDNESVNIVFDTLIDLQKENKIVGIISHVEELKERMPISLSVVNDGERGSLVFK
jgi:exonuclease SbcC